METIGKRFHLGDRSQTPHHTVKHETSQQTPSSNHEISSTDNEIFHQSCAWKTHTAATLSRACINDQDVGNLYSIKEIELFVESLVLTLPASKDRLEVYHLTQKDDSLCSKLIQYCEAVGQKNTSLSQT